MSVATPAVDEASQAEVHSAAIDSRPPARRPRQGRYGRGRVAGFFARMVATSYLDPLFERPDLIEDDYYRLRNQPRAGY